MDSPSCGLTVPNCGMELHGLMPIFNLSPAHWSERRQFLILSDWPQVWAFTLRTIKRPRPLFRRLGLGLVLAFNERPDAHLFGCDWRSNGPTRNDERDEQGDAHPHQALS